MERQNYSHYLEQEKEKKTERKGKQKVVIDAIDDIKTKKIKLVQVVKDFKAAAGMICRQGRGHGKVGFSEKVK